MYDGEDFLCVYQKSHHKLRISLTNLMSSWDWDWYLVCYFFLGEFLICLFGLLLGPFMHYIFFLCGAVSTLTGIVAQPYLL